MAKYSVRPKQEIAYDFFHGGPVSVTDARALASGYLDLQTEIKRLTIQLDKAQGGPTEDISVGNKLIRIDYVTDYRGQHRSPGDMDGSKILDLLKLNCFEKSNFSGTQVVWRGPRLHIERMITACELINNRTQKAYNIGFQDGRNLLVGLASGDVSIATYNETESRRR